MGRAPRRTGSVGRALLGKLNAESRYTLSSRVWMPRSVRKLLCGGVSIESESSRGEGALTRNLPAGPYTGPAAHAHKKQFAPAHPGHNSDHP